MWSDYLREPDQRLQRGGGRALALDLGLEPQHLDLQAGRWRRQGHRVWAPGSFGVRLVVRLQLATAFGVRL